MSLERMRKPGWNRGIVFLAAVVCAAAQNSTASPAPQEYSDQGTFVLKLAGREYGTEKFIIQSDKDKVTTQSESQLRDAATSQTIQMTSKLVLNGALEPQSYTWTDNGPQKFNLSVDFAGGIAKSKLHRPNGKDDVRDFRLPKNILILDNNVLIHYEILIDRFMKSGGGKQILQAYIPQSATPGTLTVQDAGMETMAVGGSPRSLRHLVVLSDNAQIDLWVDGNDRLQRLYWGVPQIEALRK